MTAIAPRVPRRAWVSALRAAPTGQATVPFYTLFGLIVTLNAIGLVMVLSVSSVTSLYVGQSTWFTFQRQFVWCVGGLVAMVLVLRTDYRQWKKYANAGVAITLVLLVAVLIPGIGTTANGATRWIYFGPISFQPSELAKLAMVLFAAAWLADKKGRRAQYPNHHPSGAGDLLHHVGAHSSPAQSGHLGAPRVDRLRRVVHGRSALCFR